MYSIQFKSDLRVESIFNKYPEHIRKKMLCLRDLVIQTAAEIDAITTLEETLKWGEPSYVTKYGSTLRMDWKPIAPDQYAMYFNCNTRLVETFKVIFKSTLKFEGNRAIVFHINDKIPQPELKECIKATLTYHKVKHLPTLGI